MRTIQRCAHTGERGWRVHSFRTATGISACTIQAKKKAAAPIQPTKQLSGCRSKAESATNKA
eukprot:9341462-Ditylum_brightwellii.AAC.1